MRDVYAKQAEFFFSSKITITNRTVKFFEADIVFDENV